MDKVSIFQYIENLFEKTDYVHRLLTKTMEFT